MLAVLIDLGTPNSKIWFISIYFFKNEIYKFRHLFSFRLLTYSPETKQMTEIVSGIKFANGVQLSIKEDFLLIAETTAARIMRCD